MVILSTTPAGTERHGYGSDDKDRHRMQEDTTLEYCRVEDGEMIHLVLRLQGGARTKRMARRFGLYDQKPAPAA